MVRPSTDFIAESGLMKLDPNEHEVINGIETCQNDNGILFLVVYLFLCVDRKITEMEWGPENPWPRERLISVIRSLQAYGLKAIFNRNVYGELPARLMEAHDNYSAIAAISLFADLPFAAEICDYGEESGWCFNNIRPGQWDVRCTRQGGEVAFYKLCAGRIPSIIDFIWMLGGMFISMWRWGASERQLCWVKLWVLRGRKFKPIWIEMGIWFAGIVWDLAFKLRGKGDSYIFTTYYMHPEHPNRRIGLMKSKRFSG